MVTLNFKLAQDADYYKNLPDISHNIEIDSFNDIIKQNFLNAKDILSRFNVLQDENMEIIVTESYEQDIREQSLSWGIDYSIWKEKETSVASFTLNNPEDIHHFKFYFKPYPLSADWIVNRVLEQFISANRELYLPKQFLVKTTYDYSKYNDLIEYLIRIFLEEVYFFNKIKTLGIKYLQAIDIQTFLEAFQRKIKNIHNQYQINENLQDFLINFTEEFSSFFKRCIKAYFHEYSFDNLKAEYKVIPNLISSTLHIKGIIDSDSSDRSYSKEDFIMNLKSFFELCFISITPEPDGNIRIKIINNPKLLFKGELIDTQDCIVAFVDILGFKDFISEYDNDLTSNKLKELKTAIENSVSLSTKKLKEIYQNEPFKNWGNSQLIQEIDKLLEYRVFSDCFSFSLPYFDTDKDFLTQFAAMIIVLRIFQYNMLQHRFIIRGGVSFGSYYSDNNMLFSGGLVKSYKLECKYAKMPRIIVDTEIIKRVKTTNVLLIHILGLTESLVIDNELDDYAFVNPFGLEKTLNVDFGTVVDNIETLYKQFGIDVSENEVIIEYLRILKSGSNFANLPLDLPSPFQNVQILQETNYDKINEFINSQVKTFQSKADSALNDNDRKEFTKSLGKYQWLLKLYNWEKSETKTHNDNFKYFFSKQ